jgi:hypothetical protein
MSIDSALAAWVDSSTSASSRNSSLTEKQKHQFWIEHGSLELGTKIMIYGEQSNIIPMYTTTTIYPRRMSTHVHNTQFGQESKMMGLVKEPRSSVGVFGNPCRDQDSIWVHSRPLGCWQTRCIQPKIWCCWRSNFLVSGLMDQKRNLKGLEWGEMID